MMKKKGIIISTLIFDEFENVLDKLEDMKIEVIEKRYDLLWKRYDICVKVNIKQAYELLYFTRRHNAILVKGEL